MPMYVEMGVDFFFMPIQLWTGKPNGIKVFHIVQVTFHIVQVYKFMLKSDQILFAELMEPRKYSLTCEHRHFTQRPGRNKRNTNIS